MSTDGENRHAGTVAMDALIEMPRIAEATLGFLAEVWPAFALPVSS